MVANLVEIIKKDNYFAIKYSNGICKQFGFEENLKNFIETAKIILPIPYINSTYFSIATPLTDTNAGNAPMMTCTNQSNNTFVINLSANYKSNYKWHTIGFWK